MDCMQLYKHFVSIRNLFGKKFLAASGHINFSFPLPISIYKNHTVKTGVW